jgi:hypothetical protein
VNVSGENASGENVSWVGAPSVAEVVMLDIVVMPVVEAEPLPVVVELEVLVPMDPEPPVVTEAVRDGIPPVNDREIVMPAGTCVMVPVVKIIGAAADPIRWDTVAAGVAPLAAPDRSARIATALVAAGVCGLDCVLASAVRSFRSVFAVTPPRSLWTQFVNCWLVGAVLRIDSNSAVTRWPVAVWARGLATSAAWALWPTPESNTRSSRRDAAAGIDGTNERRR